MEFYWNFAISQNWGCGGQGCYFWPNPRVLSKKSAIQDSQITFKPRLACIFLPARAKWIITVCLGTPCTLIKNWNTSKFRKNHLGHSFFFYHLVYVCQCLWFFFIFFKPCNFDEKMKIFLHQSTVLHKHWFYAINDMMSIA